MQASGNLYSETFWSLDAAATTHKTGRRTTSKGHETDEWGEEFASDGKDDEADKQPERPDDDLPARENVKRTEASAEVRRSSNAGQGKGEARREQVASDHASESFRSSSGAVHEEDEDKSDTWPADSDWSPDGEESQRDQLTERAETKTKPEKSKASMEDWSPDSHKDSAEEEAGEDDEGEKEQAQGKPKAEYGVGDDADELRVVHRSDEDDRTNPQVHDMRKDDELQDSTAKDTLQNGELYVGSEDLPVAKQTHSPKPSTKAAGMEAEGTASQDLSETAETISDASREVSPQHSDGEVGSIHTEGGRSQVSREGTAVQDLREAGETAGVSSSREFAQQGSDIDVGSIHMEAARSQASLAGTASQDLDETGEFAGTASSRKDSQQHSDTEVGSVHATEARSQNPIHDDDEDVDRDRKSANVDMKSGGIDAANSGGDLNKAPEQYAGAQDLPSIAETASNKQTTMPRPPVAISIKSNTIPSDARSTIGDVRGESSEQGSQDITSVTANRSPEASGLNKDVSKDVVTKRDSLDGLGAVNSEASIISKQSAGDSNLGAVEAEGSGSSGNGAGSGDRGGLAWISSKIASTTLPPKISGTAQLEKVTNVPAQTHDEVGAVQAESKRSDELVGDVHVENSAIKIAARDVDQTIGSTTSTFTASVTLATKPKETTKTADIGTMIEASVSSDKGIVGAISAEKPADNLASNAPLSAPVKAGTVTAEKKSVVQESIGSVKSEAVASPSVVVSANVASVESTLVSSTEASIGQTTSTSTTLLSTTTKTRQANDNEVGTIKSETLSHAELGAVSSEVVVSTSWTSAASLPSTTSTMTLSEHSTTTTITTLSALGMQLGEKAVGTVSAEIGTVRGEEGNLRGSAAAASGKVVEETIKT